MSDESDQSPSATSRRSSPSAARSSRGCATPGSSRSRTRSTGRAEIAAVRDAHDGLEAGEETDASYRVAGRIAARRDMGKAAFLDLVDGSGRIQLQSRADDLGERHDELVALDLGDIVGVEGTAFKTQARRADAARHGLGAPGEEPAPAARQVPRPRGHRDPLPPPRAGPDREPGGRASSSSTRARVVAETRRWLDERGLRRGRDAGAPAALRRRAGAAVRHPPQRARPRPLPADRDRALPQALHRRRHRARLRARQGLPQRGHLVQAQPRVHDARVVRGLRRLRRRRRAARAARRARRRRPSSGRRASSATAPRSISRRRGGG